jgi:hypothetical protein
MVQRGYDGRSETRGVVVGAANEHVLAPRDPIGEGLRNRADDGLDREPFMGSRLSQVRGHRFGLGYAQFGSRDAVHFSEIVGFHAVWIDECEVERSDAHQIHRH